MEGIGRRLIKARLLTESDPIVHVIRLGDLA
jgi:hypothetical protein